jgi:hypothetical protein
MIFFSFGIDLKYEIIMLNANIENERFSSSAVRKCHTTEVLLILNQFSTYRYGPYIQFINKKLLI